MVAGLALSGMEGRRETVEVLYGSSEGKDGGLRSRREGTDLQHPLPSAAEEPFLFPEERWGAAAAPGAGTWCSFPAWETLGVFVESSPCPLWASLSQNALALRLTRRPGVS